METKASLRGVHLSAQKGRLVADLIRGKKVDQALDILAFTPKKAAVIIKQVWNLQLPMPNIMTVLILMN